MASEVELNSGTSASVRLGRVQAAAVSQIHISPGINGILRCYRLRPYHPINLHQHALTMRLMNQINH
ncbi:hypothetical protein MSG28_009743 [Choristoneura fumiferana]|uniref:Uncharacterized protein n=1 Tax=Choristoneura fumiferana TaxID=7141 RepID=A0ACC0JCF3_CHOFU|nr:hypothetical protein MSG28_009743 [Choristoneura fumiferana]